ncbi:hypothetical protein SAMN05192568_106114 [Methylobacterium pseudosasicola]|uniref:Uncharacterized protein n=1 Tax=Methylobacterium pseudosasicola TaxID=582667 RepID=A0A1I4U0L7_9HYPH|nr:hypothetical protein SAMN05192568_106114 [Methylobacterium pseudosasicola]
MMDQAQPCLDAAAAIEGVAQELDGLGKTASAKMLRNALDVLLEVPVRPSLPHADDETKRIVDRAWERFQAGINCA